MFLLKNNVAFNFLTLLPEKIVYLFICIELYIIVLNYYYNVLLYIYSCYTIGIIIKKKRIKNFQFIFYLLLQNLTLLRTDACVSISQPDR